MDQDEERDQAESERDRGGGKSDEAASGGPEKELMANVEHKAGEEAGGPQEEEGIEAMTTEEKGRENQEKKGGNERVFEAIEPKGPAGMPLGDPVNRRGG
jgi:hypothetical protein